MFSKKAKVLISTAVFTMFGVAFTGVASARVSRSAEARDTVTATLPSMHALGGSTADDVDTEAHGNHGPRGRMRAHLEAAATALGMTPEALKTSLQGGSSLADIAKSKNVAVQKVVDAIVADEKAEIAEAVTDGKLTQAQADSILVKVTEHVTAIVNGERPAPLFGPGPRDDADGRDGHHRHHDGGLGRRHGKGTHSEDGEADETSDA